VAHMSHYDTVGYALSINLLADRGRAVEADPYAAAMDRRVFRDTGCRYAPSCLACPFERCKYDEPVPARGSRVGAK
jgi:hypothetical protein